MINILNYSTLLNSPFLYSTHVNLHHVPRVIPIHMQLLQVTLMVFWQQIRKKYITSGYSKLTLVTFEL
jgi:hypothetical protein